MESRRLNLMAVTLALPTAILQSASQTELQAVAKGREKMKPFLEGFRGWHQTDRDDGDGFSGRKMKQNGGGYRLMVEERDGPRAGGPSSFLPRAGRENKG